MAIRKLTLSAAITIAKMSHLLIMLAFLLTLIFSQNIHEFKYTDYAVIFQAPSLEVGYVGKDNNKVFFEDHCSRAIHEN